MNEHTAGNDAVHEVRRAMRALYATVPAEVARDVAERVESALAQAWDEGYVAGNAFGYEWAQDTYDGPTEDPTPNPYRTTPIPPAETANRRGVREPCGVCGGSRAGCGQSRCCPDCTHVIREGDTEVWQPPTDPGSDPARRTP